MDIFWHAIRDTFYLLKQVVPVMFAGLFCVEILVQLGLMRRLESIGRPLARVSHLPPQSIPAFFTAVGSLVAANTMLAGHHADNTITDRELVLCSVFNTVPLHFKETLTYQLPVILPLLGLRMCLIYIATFWLSGSLKLGFVIWQGRKTYKGRPDIGEENSGGVARNDYSLNGLVQILLRAFQARWGLFVKMITLLVLVTFFIQILIHCGTMNALELLVAPAAAVFHLPGAVVTPVSVYIVSPMAGISAMSALLKQGMVTEYHAIVAILAGGFLMVPIVRLRGTLPRYISILGWKHGTHVMYITTVLSLLSRVIVLTLVLLFY